jgi:hypothetical protein
MIAQERRSEGDLSRNRRQCSLREIHHDQLDQIPVKKWNQKSAERGGK